MVGVVLLCTAIQMDIIRLIFAFATAFQTQLNMGFTITCVGIVCFTVLRDR
jgi:hypothetical protein